MVQTQSFGELLRKRRLAKAVSDASFSLRQLADRVGIEPSYLSKIERGEQPPPGEQNIRERPTVVAELLRAVRAMPAKKASAISRQIRDGDW